MQRMCLYLHFQKPQLKQKKDKNSLLHLIDVNLGDKSFKNWKDYTKLNAWV